MFINRKLATSLLNMLEKQSKIKDQSNLVDELNNKVETLSKKLSELNEEMLEIKAKSNVDAIANVGDRVVEDLILLEQKIDVNYDLILKSRKLLESLKISFPLEKERVEEVKERVEEVKRDDEVLTVGIKPKGRRIYLQVFENIWNEMEIDFFDGEYHFIGDAKNIIRKYYNSSVADSYIVNLYCKYARYAVDKEGYNKYKEGRSIFLFTKDDFPSPVGSVPKLKQKHKKRKIWKRSLAIEEDDILDNRITKIVGEKYTYTFSKRVVRELSQKLNEHTTTLWNRNDLKKYVKDFLSRYFSNVTDGRIYSYINYFKEDGMISLDKDGYYHLEKSGLIPKSRQEKGFFDDFKRTK